MKKHKHTMIFIIVVVTIFLGIFTSAHPGSLDANGGHWDRKNGTYHFHAGKNTSGSSTPDPNYVYPYADFKPPYEPPTDNPYKEKEPLKKSKTSTEAPSLTELIILGIICLPFAIKLVIICLPFAISLFELLFVEALYNSLLEKHLPKYNLNLLSEKINTFQQAQDNLIEIEDKISKHNVNFKIPAAYEIGKDNLPKEKQSSGWGNAFTVYTTQHGEKIHLKYNCSFATYKRHICHFFRYYNFSNMLCQKCSKTKSLPNLNWYKKYLEGNQLKKEHDLQKQKYANLKKELSLLHKKCNSDLYKIFLFFSAKNTKTLNTINQKYKQIITDLDTTMTKGNTQMAEAVYYLTTADGETMRVPESKLEEFKKLNDEIKAKQKDSINNRLKYLEFFLDRTSFFESVNTSVSPLLDIDNLCFTEDTTINKAQQQYANKVSIYVLALIYNALKEIDLDELSLPESIDINGLAFADNETRQNKQKQYMKDVFHSVEAKINEHFIRSIN